MFCPECGSEIKPGQKFCEGCGISLTNWQVASRVEREKAESQPEPEASQARPMPQPQPKPAAPQANPEPPAQPQPKPKAPRKPQAPTPAPPEPPSQQKKKSMLPLAIGIGAAVLIAAVVVVVVFVVKPGGGSAQKGVWVQTKMTSNGKQDKGTWNIEQQYKLDEAGNPISFNYSYNDSENHKSKISELYTFDKSGQCLSCERTTDGKTEHFSYEWNSLGDERPKSMSVVNDDTKKQDSTNTYEYNDQGFIKRVTANMTLEDQSKLKRIYDFDEDGHSTRIETSNDDNNMVAEFTYERDKNNRIVSSHTKSVNKKTNKTEQETETTYEYDENGNLAHEVDKTTAYSDGKKTATESTEVTFEYTYVENPSPWRRVMQHLYFGSPMVY